MLINNSNMDVYLVILFIMNKMEVPLTKETFLKLATEDNDWLNYMDAASSFDKMVDDDFLAETDYTLYKNTTYLVTANGRQCLALFFSRIPYSLRTEMLAYINANRLEYKKLQEYFSDYTKNNDGTYNVNLKVQSDNNAQPRSKNDHRKKKEDTLMEISFNVDELDDAEKIAKNWRSKGSEVFEYLYASLVLSE